MKLNDERELILGQIDILFPAYSITAVFPKSGQGTVVRASRYDDGKDVVIKICHYTKGSHHDHRRVFLEADKLSQLDNPHIVKLVDHGTVLVNDRPVPFIVTDFIDGTDLRAVFEERRLSEGEAWQLLANIGSAIDDLWKQLGVVHCDINPRNIMLRTNGEFVLIDLGIAKHPDANITALGETLGTVGYMAPEQIAGRKNLTCRVDIFALGIVAYEGVSGMHPFQGRNPTAMSKVLPLKYTDAKVSESLAQCIERMLSLEPYKRPASVNELIERKERGLA